MKKDTKHALAVPGKANDWRHISGELISSTVSQTFNRHGNFRALLKRRVEGEFASFNRFANSSWLLLRGIHRVAIVSNWASPGKQDGRCGIHRKYA